MLGHFYRLNMGLSRPLFIYFPPFYNSIANLNYQNRKWCKWCAQDSNPVLQDGRRRQIRWTNFVAYVSSGVYRGGVDRGLLSGHHACLILRYWVRIPLNLHSFSVKYWLRKTKKRPGMTYTWKRMLWCRDQLPTISWMSDQWIRKLIAVMRLLNRKDTSRIFSRLLWGRCKRI